MYVCVYVCVRACTCVFICSLQSHELYWDFQDKNTGVGCHFLLQGIFLIPVAIETGSPTLQEDSLPLSYLGSP